LTSPTHRVTNALQRPIPKSS